VTDRRGFTLIEVAFSLAIVAGAVVTLLALFPMGIRTQNQARFKLLAAAKAMEMLESFRDGTSGGNITDANDLDKEGIMPWDTGITYRAFAPDLECAITNLRGGFKPLPNEIAYRLDSDNDEIRKLLDSGGYVFYCVPSRPNGHYDGTPPSFDNNWLSENRKLLIGVVGMPQQNAILYHPSVKVGPYQDWYPSPPTYLNEFQRDQPNGQPDSNTGVSFISVDALCRDVRIAQVMNSDFEYTYRASGGPQKRRFGYKPYHDNCGINDNNAMVTGSLSDLTGGGAAAQRLKERRVAAVAYVVAALWYCKQANLAVPPAATATPPVPAITTETQLTDFVNANATTTTPARVLAMRYLAHAAACLTRWFATDLLKAGIDFGLPNFGSAPDNLLTTPLEMDGVRAGRITMSDIQIWHEASLRMAVRFANEAGPYNWGVPRPLNRQVMMDHPLVQLDLWSQPISAPIPAVGGGTTVQSQWRACYPKSISNPGLPYSYPGRVRDTNGDGVVDHRDAVTGGARPYPPRILDCGRDGVQATDLATADAGSNGVLDENDHPVPGPPGVEWQPAVGPANNFNLTAAFRPSERCRQIVVWSVDWQSYEDFETAPSAPLDASRYPAMAPQAIRQAGQTHWTSSWIQWNPAIRQGEVAYRGGVIYSECIRNPEHILLFREPAQLFSGGSAGSSQLVRRQEPTMLVSNIDNFGGNADSDTTFSGGDTGTINECEPMTGQSPDIVRLRTGTEQPMFVELAERRRSVNRAIFLGRYGANRNAVATPESITGVGFTKNGVVGAGIERNGAARSGGGGPRGDDPSRYYSTGWVDGGIVPKSVHLRASQVARFNYYDGRLQGALRN